MTRDDILREAMGTVLDEIPRAAQQARDEERATIVWYLRGVAATAHDDGTNCSLSECEWYAIHETYRCVARWIEEESHHMGTKP